MYAVLSFITDNLNANNDPSYNVCGYHDWRLPNVNEMTSIINPGQSPEWLNSQGFVDIKDRYWTSTTSVYSPNMAFYVGIGGSIQRYDRRMSYAPLFMAVRDTMIEPVAQVIRTGQTTCYDLWGNAASCSGTGQDGELRKGVAPPSLRFANPDGSVPAIQDVVLDRQTYLMWTRNANLTGQTKYWQGALDFVASLNTGSGYGGYKDWRLPNMFELRSLQDYSQFSPAVPVDHPFTNIPSESLYWTSDTYHGYPHEAWTVGMNGYLGGMLGINGKTVDDRWVWAVRGGAPNAALGDLNLDGNVDLVDTIIALQVMAGVSTLNQPQMNYADTNQDGRIGLAEAIYLLRDVAGLP